MPYIGNIPATQFAALTYQDLTGGSGTSFTLDTSVGSAQDIEVFVNNVRQEPGVAYTISGGTTLNMTGTIASTDDFYVVFQGKAVGTVTHPPLSALEATTGTFSGDVTIDRGSSTGTHLQITTTGSGHNIDMTDSSSTARIRNASGFLRIGADHNNESADSTLRFEVDGSEAARLDASGNLLVGKTTASTSTAGAQIASNGRIEGVVDGGEALRLNRITSDGDIAVFRKDNSTVGSIGAANNELFIDSASAATGISFRGAHWRPRDAGADIDNGVDLGSGSFRFDDIFATNGTIQTSDQNEKQQIASLTSAEITAATAISKLFKTYKWNSAVTEKGDAARTHTGVIAQQVETAMTDAGLDAGDYAFFISTDWYVDADGNEVEADAVGAIAKNRKGIRYPELLAFVGSATEQRLADIETRLTALENA